MWISLLIIKEAINVLPRVAPYHKAESRNDGKVKEISPLSAITCVPKAAQAMPCMWEYINRVYTLLADGNYMS